MIENKSDQIISCKVLSKLNSQRENHKKEAIFYMNMFIGL